MCKFCMKHFYALTVTNMVTVRNFEALVDIFKVMKIMHRNGYLLIHSLGFPFHID
jgi:hypothetical protein